MTCPCKSVRSNVAGMPGFTGIHERLSAGIDRVLKELGRLAQAAASVDMLEQAQQSGLDTGRDTEHAKQQHQYKTVTNGFHVSRRFFIRASRICCWPGKPACIPADRPAGRIL